MQEAFSDGIDILFVEDIKASTLAAKIVELKNNPELVKKVGQGALKSYEEKLSNKKAKDILQEAIFKRLENA
jgi:glycosyltransferase involved in cell wall biosynthesis